MDEREFELINIIGPKLASNQRDISHQLNLSLGMTNMLIRRLVTKGYIRISQLDKKKVEYILTSKGFTEKMQKSIKYTMKTISSIGQVKRRVQALVSGFHDKGVRKFYMLGESDLCGIIEMSLWEKYRGKHELKRIESMDQARSDGIVLNCREKPGISLKGLTTVNVIEELAKDDVVGNLI